MVEELLCLVGSPYLSSFPATVWAGYACSGVSSSCLLTAWHPTVQDERAGGPSLEAEADGGSTVVVHGR